MQTRKLGVIRKMLGVIFTPNMVFKNPDIGLYVIMFSDEEINHIYVVRVQLISKRDTEYIKNIIHSIRSSYCKGSSYLNALYPP